MVRHLTLAVALSATLALPAFAQDSKDKNLDIQSSVGDLHVGNDADARKAGLPLYPGARIKTGKSDGDSDQANFGVCSLKRLDSSWWLPITSQTTRPARSSTSIATS